MERGETGEYITIALQGVLHFKDFTTVSGVKHGTGAPRATRAEAMRR